jgi:hypothetical protein
MDVASNRSLLDRLVPAIVPKTIVTHAPAPAPIDTNLWTVERRSRMPGGPVLPTRTTVVGIGGGELLVVSPPPVECGGLEALDALGAVRHVVVPNAFHHLHARGFLERYPDAVFWAAPGLSRRVAGLPPATELAAGIATPWSHAVDHAVLEATDEVSEVAFFHRDSATLVLTDLAFHMTTFAGTFDRISWRLSGVPNGFGHSRTARMLLLRDRHAAKIFLERVLAWPFRRILVAHGDPVDHDAIGVFRRAFRGYLT